MIMEAFQSELLAGALIVHTTLHNSALATTKNINFNFRLVPKLSIGFNEPCK